MRLSLVRCLGVRVVLASSRVAIASGSFGHSGVANFTITAITALRASARAASNLRRSAPVDSTLVNGSQPVTAAPLGTSGALTRRLSWHRGR